MKKSNHLLIRITLCISFFAFIYLGMINVSSCSKRENADDTISKWVDWNVSFPDGISNTQVLQTVSWVKTVIQDAVSAYNDQNNTTYSANIFIYYCPCDSSLVNISATLLRGSGPSAGNPTPPSPPRGGSGDIVGLLVSQNQNMETDIPLEGSVDSIKVDPKVNVIDRDRILAIIDTGIDTNYFKLGISSIIWRKTNGTGTLADFTVNPASVYNMFDDNHSKHGTAVAALALQAIRTMTDLTPRLMILKALDANNLGSTFTVSCALSYATQNNATIINASLGYYSQGEIDSVLNKYISKTRIPGANGIPIVTAAGNKPGAHNRDSLCQKPAALELGDRRFFYPACFSTTYDYVIAVTSLRNKSMPCIYQNYSNTYVNAGVYNENDCCFFRAPFLETGYEGSSFATPIVSGIMMGHLLRNGGDANCLNLVTITEPGLSPYVKDGRYLLSP